MWCCLVSICTGLAWLGGTSGGNTFPQRGLGSEAPKKRRCVAYMSIKGHLCKFDILLTLFFRELFILVYVYLCIFVLGIEFTH